MDIRDIKKFPNPHYHTHVGFDFIEKWLDNNDDPQHGCTIDMDPDFQRAHVWTEEQQIRFIEFCLKEGQGSRNIYWNHPTWMGSFKGALTLVDGKQRLEAARKFVRNELPVFGGHYLNDFERPKQACRVGFFDFYVNTLSTKEEMLQWYLDINSGGVVHTADELDKVKKLLQNEINS